MRTYDEVKDEMFAILKENDEIIDKMNTFNNKEKLTAYIEDGKEVGDLIEFRKLNQKHMDNMKKLNELQSELMKVVMSKSNE